MIFDIAGFAATLSGYRPTEQRSVYSGDTGDFSAQQLTLFFRFIQLLLCFLLYVNIFNIMARLERTPTSIVRRGYMNSFEFEL